MHFFFWLIFISMHAFFLYDHSDAAFNGFPLKGLLLFSFYFITLFYLHSEILYPKLFLKKKEILYFTAVIFLFLITLYLKPFDTFNHPDFRMPGKQGDVQLQFSRIDKIPHPQQRHMLPHFDIISIFLFFIMLAVGILLDTVKSKRLTEQRAVEAEADKAKAELSFLKAQVNPHFLFNTLNNLYSLAVSGNAGTADGIMKLSKIMRYILEDARADRALLEEEIDCINNYVELQKLRLTAHTVVEYSIEGDTFNKKIAPLILMSFIENTFKHGVSTRENSVILIRIIVNGNSISLITQNKYYPERQDSSREGIGMGNTLKRLNFYYKDHYSLETVKEHGEYKVKLIIHEI